MCWHLALREVFVMVLCGTTCPSRVTVDAFKFLSWYLCRVVLPQFPLHSALTLKVANIQVQVTIVSW